jgi:hypothetical protein
VCDADRVRLHSHLAELAELGPLLPYALAPGSAGGARVSGSREAPTPTRLGALNLIGPAATGPVRDTLIPAIRSWTTTVDVGDVAVVVWHRGLARDGNGDPVWVPAGDQVGPVPTAAFLDEWVGDWAELRGRREYGPQRTVPLMAGWLRARVDWACDHHPAVVDFATELISAVCAVRAALNVSRRPTWYDKVCAQCKLLALYRRDANAAYIECRNCGTLVTDAEYEDLPERPRRARPAS